MESTSTTRYTAYENATLRVAVSDVLERAGCHDYVENRENGVETVTATVKVLDNESEFFFHIQDWLLGSLMTVTITRPHPGLTRAGELRAVDNLADHTLQLVENAAKILPLKLAEEKERTRNAPKQNRRLLTFLRGDRRKKAKP